MSATKFFNHFFLPHGSNNQKAKLIHTDSLVLLTLFVVGFQLLLNVLPKTFPSVLGFAANISPSEVITLTNKERAANGLSPLTENKTLDSAALAKGNDMLKKGYWAHFAPDGTSPWSFFTGFGYRYQYAGENLARDFSSASAAVNAWMNSPSHKENILNPHYKEVGIGVVEGTLSGADTTIIVQFFGSPLGGAPSIPVAKAADVSQASPTPSAQKPQVIATVQTPVPTHAPTLAPTQTPESKTISAKVSPFQTTRGLSLGLVGLLLLIFSIDLFVVRSRNIVRLGGRTLAHLAYLSMILAVVLLLKAGQII